MIMACWHSKSQRYYVPYLILPLLALIAETGNQSIDVIRKEGKYWEIDIYIYYALFAGVFSIPIWGLGGDADHWIAGSMYILCLRALVTDVQELIADQRDRKMLPQ